MQSYINLKSKCFDIIVDKLWKHCVCKFKSATGNTFLKAVLRRGVMVFRKYFNLNNFLIKKMYVNLL